MTTASIAANITANLASYGMKDVAFYDIPETTLTAIRITDQPFNDIDLVNMIAHDLVEPCGVDVSSYGSNCLYTTDQKLGAVIVVRGLQ